MYSHTWSKYSQTLIQSNRMFTGCDYDTAKVSHFISHKNIVGCLHVTSLLTSVCLNLDLF